jgi:FKBP-type peptidyl-prolyl cis-trans isomerase 2
MISFKPRMNNEKIAIIAVVIIIAGALSLFLVSSFGEDIFANLFDDDTKTNTGEDSIIEEGDCADVQYIGRYASNDTIFDTSYEDVAVDAGIYDASRPYEPLNVFVNRDRSAQPPADYADYSSGLIDGLISRLIGAEEGKSYTFTIPPEEAYGANKLETGAVINTTVFNQNIFDPTNFINQSLQVNKKTDTRIELEWINPPQQFTLPNLIIFGSLDITDPNPAYEDAIEMCPPFAIWEDATEVIETKDTYYLTKTTPIKTENLTENITQVPLDLFGEETLFIIPDATSVTYDESIITFHLDPEEGKVYRYEEQTMFGPVNIELTVSSVTNDLVNISIYIVEYDQNQSYSVAREINFNRTFEYPRIYDMELDFLQQALPEFEMDLQREGYSIHHLAGETLVFEVTIESVYKTS